MKKILFILTFSISTLIFANQEPQTYSPKINQEKTVKNLTAYPNPLTTETNISFYIEKSQNVILRIKNLLGKTIFTKEFRAVNGENKFTFYRDNLESGMYIYSIQTSFETTSKRLVIK